MLATFAEVGEIDFVVRRPPRRTTYKFCAYGSAAECSGGWPRRSNRRCESVLKTHRALSIRTPDATGQSELPDRLQCLIAPHAEIGFCPRFTRRGVGSGAEEREQIGRDIR